MPLGALKLGDEAARLAEIRQRGEERPEHLKSTGLEYKPQRHKGRQQYAQQHPQGLKHTEI